MLHDLIYDVICEICYDYEYIYMSYVSVFNEITGKIYAKSIACESGFVEAAGIKSDYTAVFIWELIRRIGFTASDAAKFDIIIKNKYTGKNISHKKYILNISSGEITEYTKDTVETNNANRGEI